MRILYRKLSFLPVLVFLSVTTFAQTPATTPPPVTPPAPPVVTTPRPAAPTAPMAATAAPRPRVTAAQPPAEPAAIPGPVWKKQVTRDIELGEKIDTNLHRLRSPSPDNTLLEMFATGVKNGRVSAYSVPEFLMTNRLNINDFNRLFIGRPDTTAVRDAAGRYTMKIYRKQFSFANVHKYRILEEWTSYPAIGKTEVQIVGLAPLLDVVAPDGTVNGVNSLFWVRYTEDIKALIARYDQYHPNSTLGGHLWEDYFRK